MCSMARLILVNLRAKAACDGRASLIAARAGGTRRHERAAVPDGLDARVDPR
jgi:hypothetical protein